MYGVFADYTKIQISMSTLLTLSTVSIIFLFINKKSVQIRWHLALASGWCSNIHSPSLKNFEFYCINLYAIANNENFPILLCQKITDENVKFKNYNVIK